jgi:ABC-type glycerol-3-phosphate transport system substrate-binding protein
LFTGDDGKNMDAIVKKFNDSHPDIKVTHVAMDAMTDLYVKLPMVAGNDSQAPDIAVVWSTFIPYLVEKKAIQPIEMITDTEPKLADENFTSSDLVHYNGNRYGAMLDFPSVSMYANKDLIAKYDPDIISDNVITWDEVFDLASKLKAAGVDGDIKALASGAGASNDIEQNFLAAGKNYTEDGKTLTLTEEDLSNAMGYFKKLNDEGGFMAEDADAFGLFTQGKAVLCTGGTWNMNAAKDSGINFVELPPVQVDASNVVTNAVAHTFVLPQRSYTDEKKKAVATFITWFEDNAILWAQAGSVVANKNVSSSDEFKKMPQYLFSTLAKQAVPNYLYLSIAEDALTNYGWQPVYNHISVDDYSKAVIAKIKSSVAAQ